MINASHDLKHRRGVDGNTFKKRLQYHLKHQKLWRLRKGLYSDTDPSGFGEEEAKQIGGLIYSPSYRSFESVLFEHDIVFQWSDTHTYAGPYTKTIPVAGFSYQFRRIPPLLLTLPLGIIHTDHGAQATPERALCDILYTTLSYPIDHIPESLSLDLMQQLLPHYEPYRRGITQQFFTLCDHFHDQSKKSS